MKTRSILITLGAVAFLALPCALLPSCANMSPQQKAGLATIADIAIGAAASHYGVPPSDTQAITTGVNALFGVASQAQANVGQTPAQANISQGSNVPAIGAAIQNALPNTPISQTTVDALFQAAQQKAPATP